MKPVGSSGIQAGLHESGSYFGADLMNKHKHQAIKAGAWYTVSSFLIRGIGFITTPVFARLLTKAEFF